MSSSVFCSEFSSVSKKMLCLSRSFCICDTAVFLSDAGGAMAIFRDEVLVLNEVDKRRSCWIMLFVFCCE